MCWMAEYHYVPFIITDKTICIHREEDAISYSSNSSSIKSIIKQDRRQWVGIESKGWVKERESGVEMEREKAGKEVVIFRENSA